MLTVLTAAVAGFVHVLTGPDHMAAVAPLAIAGRRRGWLAGWTWGIGHAAGVVTIAALAVSLRDLLPPVSLLAAWSERLVGGALIGLGLWALRSGLRIRTSSHHHGGVTHAHVHVQRGPVLTRRWGHAHAAFCMGILHGVAGSSHFLGVLPALALPTRALALTYIATFGAATVVSMTMFAALVGTLAGRSAGRGGPAHRVVVLAGAGLSIAVGIVWMSGVLPH